METWEIYEATPDELRLVRNWASKRNAVTERVDDQTLLVHCEDGELEDELSTLCDDYDIKSRLL